MSTRLLTALSSTAAIVACISFPSSAPAADLLLHKVPPLTVDQAPAYPQNLARTRLGARIDETVTDVKLATGSAQVDADTLLSPDPAKGVALPAGTTTVTIALSAIESVDTISFLSTARGNVSIAAASAKLPANSPQWKTLTEQPLNGDMLTAKVGPAEAKYIRIKFAITEAGRVAGLGVYSTNAVSDFTMPRKTTGRENRTVGFISASVSDLHQRARALYVSSGADVEHANNIIDDKIATSYAFDAEDSSPTAIVDLGQTKSLRRIAAAYSSHGGKIDFYVLTNLPGAPAGIPANADTAPASLRIKEADVKSVGSVADDGSGRAAIDFSATTGRYVMVKWTPAQTTGNLTVAEVAAFGGNDENSDVVASNKTRTDSSDGKAMIDEKDMIETKDMPGEGPQDTPGEGPDNTGLGLPQAPPFVFVPELLPVSH